MTRDIMLYVDDVRDAPPNWVTARDSKSAIAVLRSGLVDALSLDFDLGGAGTIEPVLDWMETAAKNGWRPPRMMIAHSQNPVGRNLTNLRLIEVLRFAADYNALAALAGDYSFDYADDPTDIED